MKLLILKNKAPTFNLINQNGVLTPSNLFW